MSGLCIALAVLCVVLAASLGSTASQIRKDRKRFNSLNRQYHAIYQRFKNIIDVEEAHAHLSKLFNMERARAKATMLDLKHNHDQMLKTHEQNKKKLKEETNRIVHAINSLQEELDQLTEKRLLQEFSFYKPRYDFENAEGYRRKLDEIRNAQQSLLIKHRAAVCYSEMTGVVNSKEGKKLAKDTMKLVLRAFNAECDAAVSRVSAKNVDIMEKRINKAFESINLLARFKHIEISHEYLRLKLNELYLTHEFHSKLEEEKEEQRKIREHMLETENIQKELKEAATAAAVEEEKLTSLLEEAHRVAEDASDEELAPLLEEIERIQVRLNEAQINAKRTASHLQQVTAGYVYILSNLGSFGEHIYKIGMTRRLDPMAYIKQLGDNAAPFQFDIHALIYSDNAELLVKELHKELAHNRVNHINSNTEFYQISIEEIERILHEYDADIEITHRAAAEEYRRSLTMCPENHTKDRPATPIRAESPDMFLALSQN
ncbi:MAG: DUF4041 domain-containing protein [Rhodothermaceae bacterium]|nr:DUF4041 domain-containing protein [Rhodothermaceae bacterium]